MIYIHIPFCRQICSYCDFHHTASLLRQDEILAAIEQELHQRHTYIDSPKTIYFGGGTPSVCSIEQIKRLVDTVKELWKVDSFSEVTLEANPEDLTLEYLQGLNQSGINRLSIGIQSFHEEHLTKMNRRHTAQRAIDAVRDAQKVGFDNITIDLIYGLPWMNIEQWHNNIRTALSLGVQHISAYHLTIEPRTLLAKRSTTPVEDTVSQQHFEILHHELTAAGYEHYEVSNFAKEGYRAIHNSGYWHSEPYLGVGPSAHSYNGSHERHWNVSSNKLYLEGNKGESETLTPQDIHNEYIMTRLRTSDGINLKEYNELFGREIPPTAGIVIDNEKARIEPCDFLISDSIIVSLFD